MLKLLAFDLDDTLYPESSYAREGFRTVSAYMRKKYKIDAGKFYKKLVSTKTLTPSAKIFDIVLENYRLKDAKLVGKLIELYRAQTLKIRLFPGVKSMLNQFRKKYTLAVITEGKEVVQKRKINHLKIAGFFDTILYTLDLGDDFKKPSELPFKQLLNSHKIKPQEAIYIGNDPDKDFIGAKKIGMKTVRINQGIFRGKITNKSTEADFIIGSIKELPSLIVKIENQKLISALN